MHTSNEECIASEHSFLVTILEQVADAVLGVTRCVQCLDFDALPNGESLAVAWGFGHFRTVFASNDRYGVRFELQRVSISLR